MKDTDLIRKIRDHVSCYNVKEDEDRTKLILEATFWDSKNEHHHFPYAEIPMDATSVDDIVKMKIENEEDQIMLENRNQFANMDIKHWLTMENGFFNTPVNERLEDMRYRLQWIHTDRVTNYLAVFHDGSSLVYIEGSDFYLRGRGEYTQAEIDKIKTKTPKLAPLIEMMKERALPIFNF